MALSYHFIMNLIIRGLVRLTFHPLPLLVEPDEPVSIVISMRNEADHIDVLINDLSRLYYPQDRLEIILVDDHSQTKQIEYIAAKLRRSSLKNCRLLHNPGEGKKKALYYGIVEASHELILQTDADCRIPAMWVNSMAATLLANKEAEAVIGAVKMQPSSGFWSRFAALDFMSLQASGVGLALRKKVIMANGANLGFYRKTWLKHRENGAGLSSGDDVFFIQSLAKNNKSAIAFCSFEHSIISTPAPAKMEEFLQQRIRWGSKSRAYTSKFSKIVALTVGLSSISIVVFLLLGFWDYRLHEALLVIFIAKFMIDAWVLKSFARETQQASLLKVYPFSAFVYPFYISWVVFKMVFPFSNNKWKGRPVRT